MTFNCDTFLISYGFDYTIGLSLCDNERIIFKVGRKSIPEKYAQKILIEIGDLLIQIG